MEKFILNIILALVLSLALGGITFLISRKSKKENEKSEKLALKYSFKPLDTSLLSAYIPLGHAVFTSRPKNWLWQATQARCSSFIDLDIPGYDIFYASLQHHSVPENAFNGARQDIQAIICNLEHDSPYIKIVRNSFWHYKGAMAYVDKPVKKLKGERFPCSRYTIYSEEPLTREFEEFFIEFNKMLYKAGINIEISQGSIIFYKYGISSQLENFMDIVLPLIKACADVTPKKEAEPCEECRKILNFINCDYELFKNTKSGDKIMARFDELAKQGLKDGFCPLVIVPSATLALILTADLENSNPENSLEAMAAWRKDVIEESSKINVADFINTRFDDYMQMHEGDDLLGEFIKGDPVNTFSSYLYAGRPYKEVIIAKIPTQNPWEIAAWLPVGGFNDAPSSAEQVAVFKYWYEKYGAVAATVSYDIWEMRVKNPPVTNEAAELLAKEHFGFCYDTVMQGSESIRALASALKTSSVWHFWWD